MAYTITRAVEDAKKYQASNSKENKFNSLKTIFTYFLRVFIYVDHFKVFIVFFTILLLLHVLVFWLEAYGILALQSEIRPTPPAVEGEVLTTGFPGKSPKISF